MAMARVIPWCCGRGRRGVDILKGKGHGVWWAKCGFRVPKQKDGQKRFPSCGLKVSSSYLFFDKGFSGRSPGPCTSVV